jgi:Phosphotransferase enzyme family
MWPVGWEALGQWGDDVVRIEPLTGGVGVNEVWSVRVNGHLAVGRLGQRSDADLAWETDLLRHLDREGMPVPVPIPATDGRHFADGLVVMTYVEGGPPETQADWRRVADTLRQLHRLTRGWPQRPGWRSSTDLLHAETGTKVDLGAMPPEGVVRCRAAWAQLTGRTTCIDRAHLTLHDRARPMQRPPLRGDLGIALGDPRSGLACQCETNRSRQESATMPYSNGAAQRLPHTVANSHPSWARRRTPSVAASSGRRGRRFKSGHPDQKYQVDGLTARVAAGPLIV